jgi:hypothetical protein
MPMREPLHPPALWAEIFVDLLCSYVDVSASSAVEHHRARTLTVGRIPVRHSHHLRCPPPQVLVHLLRFHPSAPIPGQQKNL